MDREAMNAWNEHVSREGKAPAFWISAHNTPHMVPTNPDNRPVYWKKRPPTDEELLQMKQESKNPREFAMMIYEWCWREE